MSTLLVLRGISGSGKSTFTEMLRMIEPSLVHTSADFIHVDSDGAYRFDPSKLGEGHGVCFRQTIEALSRGEKLIVVDNTNTTRVEMAPYIAAGQAYQYKTAIVRMEVPPTVAASRNVHGVSADLVQSMYSRMESPIRRWPSETVFRNPSEDDVLNFYAELTR